MESRKTAAMNQFAKQKQRYRQREQTYGHQEGKEGWGELSDWGWHLYTTVYKTDKQ